MKQDKRTIIRRRTQQLVYLELGRENGGVMLNLSEEGCGFQAITPVKCGETRFAFQINGGRRIAGDAEVVWADEAGIMGGLRFLNLPVEAHREIRLWLNETNAPPEPGFVPAAVASSVGAQRVRSVGGEERTVPAASIRVAEEEPPPAPPPWLNVRAGNYPLMDDERFRAPFRNQESFRTHRQESAAVWRGIAMLATIVALAALVIVYQHDVGTSLIWLGETLTGRMKASSVVPDRQPASSIPPTTDKGGLENSATNPAANKDAPSQKTDDIGLPADKELATAGRPEIPGTGSGAGSSVGVSESVLEGQGLPQKSEPTWNAGDSVESLWGAVQAGSVSAEMSLAERFARGEGVKKNCDQAKVLMKAAADRGNREARLRLYEMETAGCR